MDEQRLVEKAVDMGLDCEETANAVYVVSQFAAESLLRPEVMRFMAFCLEEAAKGIEQEEEDRG